MPRVTTHTKNRGGTKVHRCARCGLALEPGQRYYYWAKRYGDFYQHVTCGYPRPTQLSGRKTAAVEEAVQDAQAAVSSWSPEFPGHGQDSYEVDTSDLESALEDAATSAEEVAEEYEDGKNNMPDSLQYSPTAEAMEEVANELRYFADTLRDAASFDGTVDEPTSWTVLDGTEGDADGEEVLDWEMEWDGKVEELRQAAEDALSEPVPEYQG